MTKSGAPESWVTLPFTVAAPPLLMFIDCGFNETSPATVRSEPAPSIVTRLFVMLETTAVPPLESCSVKPVSPLSAVSLPPLAKAAWSGPAAPVRVRGIGTVVETAAIRSRASRRDDGPGRRDVNDPVTILRNHMGSRDIQEGAKPFASVTIVCKFNVPPPASTMLPAFTAVIIPLRVSVPPLTRCTLPPLAVMLAP